MILVPTERLRPVVDAWIAGYPLPQQAFESLEAAGGGSAGGWRARFSEGHSQSWWRKPMVDEVKVDEFFALADMTYLWWTVFDDLLQEAA